jgi:hypothetical protein
MTNLHQSQVANGKRQTEISGAIVILTRWRDEDDSTLQNYQAVLKTLSIDPIAMTWRKLKCVAAYVTTFLQSSVVTALGYLISTQWPYWLRARRRRGRSSSTGLIDLICFGAQPASYATGSGVSFP